MIRFPKSPMTLNIKEVIRKEKILRKHKSIANYWSLAIRDYFDNKIERYSFKPLKEFSGSKKVIWQYWGQGIDVESLPEVVRTCFATVEKYKGEYDVIRLSDDTVGDYIELPDFIKEKLSNGQLNRVFFSDLLRLMLLNTYGGVWLDATILLTSTLPEEYAKFDYFVFQRDNDEKYRSLLDSPASQYWGWGAKFKVKVLNSIIYSNKKSEPIQIMMDLLLYHWKTQKRAPTYFFFQILYTELMEKYLPSKRCPIVSDFIPHYIQTKILTPSMLAEISYKDILKKTALHKMTYYKDDALDRFRSFVSEFEELLF